MNIFNKNKNVIFKIGINNNSLFPDIDYFFSTVTSNSIDMSAEITDHYVENNFMVQDHMAIKPVVYTISGFVGEKVYRRELQYTDQLERVLSKLTPIEAFLPGVSSYAQTVINAAAYIESSINRYKASFNRYKNFYKDMTKKNELNQNDADENDTERPEQNRIYNTFLGMMNNRQIGTLYIPNVGKVENLLIQNVKMEQDESEYKSRLVVELKEYRPVEVAITPLTKEGIEKYTARCAQQKAATENLGKVQGKKDNRTITKMFRDFLATGHL